AVLVEAVVEVTQIDDVALIPDARRDAMTIVRLRGDGAVLGAACSPSALSLHAAMAGLGSWPLRPGADAVRHLIEAVLHRFRTDLDRLEKDVVFWVSCHVDFPPDSKPK